MAITEVSFTDTANAGNFITLSDYPALGVVTDNDWTQTADSTVTTDTADVALLASPAFAVQGMSQRFYFRRIGAEDGNNMNVCDIINENGDGVAQMRIRSGSNNGDLQFRDQTTAAWVSSTEVANDEWARIEIQYDLNTLTMSARIFVGANLEGTTPDEEQLGISMSNRTSTSLQRVRVGTPAINNPTMQMEFRDIAWADELTWIGPYVAPSSGFSPLDIAWDHAVWADQPGFTPPGDGVTITSDPDNLGANGTSWTRENSPAWRTDIGGSGKPAFYFPNEARLRCAVGTAMGNPRTFVAVARTLSTSNSDVFDSSSGRSLLDGVSGFWRIYAGSDVGYASPDTDLHLFVVTFNGASSSIEVDNVTVASGSAGTNTADTNVFVGAAPLGTMPHNGSEVAFYGGLDGTLTTQEKSDLWDWYQAEYLGIGGPSGPTFNVVISGVEQAAAAVNVVVSGAEVPMDSVEIT